VRLILACLLLLSVGGQAQAGVKPAKVAKVYKEADGLIEVTVVELEPVDKGDVLLMVDNANSVLDGLILPHSTKTQGVAQAYVLYLSGEHTRMRAEDGYWFKQYSLYLPEKPTKTVTLFLDVKASKAADPKKLVKKYEAQDMKAIKAKIHKVYNP